MTELLKQGLHQPQPVEKQVLVIYAGTNGFIDSLPIEAIGRYERELFAFVDARHPQLWEEMRSKGNSGKEYDALAARMKAVLQEFGKEFAVDAKA
jgi:F-type H+-transporting ATPase subunit alpha